ncbi:hypothetical protein Tco_0431054, partial [Tanacetum coccineum]
MLWGDLTYYIICCDFFHSLGELSMAQLFHSAQLNRGGDTIGNSLANIRILRIIPWKEYRSPDHEETPKFPLVFVESLPSPQVGMSSDHEETLKFPLECG